MKVKQLAGAVAMAVVLLAASATPAGAAQPISIEVDGQILPRVTPEWLAKAKVKYAKEFVFLRKLNDANGFPEGTLPTLWVVESMCGELNIKNDSGFEGMAQLGPYEQHVYGVKNPYDLEDAFGGVVRLLRDYHQKFQLYSKKPVDWSQRSMTDWYDLHRSGFRGAAMQYNTALGLATLEPVLIRNIRANTPQTIKERLFVGKLLRSDVTQTQLVTTFYAMWDYELNRIWTAIKE